MQVEIFTIPLIGSEEVQEQLNHFLPAHRVAEVRKELGNGLCCRGLVPPPSATAYCGSMQAKCSLENDSATGVSLGGSVVVEIDAIVGIDFLWRGRIPKGMHI